MLVRDQQYLVYRRGFKANHQRNPGIYYNTIKRLESLRLNWKSGLTVQVLAPHPYNPTSFLWAHNVLEKKPTRIKRYGYLPKPDGYGNAGGGLEKLIYVPHLDMYLTELQILAMRRPDHPILTDQSLSKETKIVLAGGLREFVDETGFRDIEIRTDYPNIFLSDYVYPPWVDEKGVVHPGGHRKITLWGKLTSLIEDRIIESNEIDRTDWIDLACSLPGQFFKLGDKRPYFSHVLSTLGGVLRVYRYEKSVSDGFVPNIPGRVHPSWWYIYQVGRGDPRFPERGYKLSPSQWYKLFGTMKTKSMEEADNDFFVRFIGQKELDEAKRREEGWFNRTQAQIETSSSQAKEVAQTVEDSEDSEGIPTLDQMIQIEDEEYGRWFERKLPQHLRVIKAEPVV